MSKLTAYFTFLRNSRRKQLITATISLLGLIVLLTVYVNHFRCSASGNNAYSIVIDAGSTHSEALLFRSSTESTGDDKSAGQLKLSPVTSCGVNKGIALGYNGDYKAAGADLAACITDTLLPYLERCSIPAKDVPLHLAATAGVRVMEMGDPGEPAKLFAAVRSSLEATGVTVKHVGTISGQIEALYAWMAVNFLEGKLSGNVSSSEDPKTTGIIEMGGASAQFAQEVSGSSLSGQFGIKKKLFGVERNVEGVSHICFGAEEAFRRYVSSRVRLFGSGQQSLTLSCLPKGYTAKTDKFRLSSPCCAPPNGPTPPEPDPPLSLVGTGDYHSCQTEIQVSMLSGCREYFAHCPSAEAVSVRPKMAQFYALGAFSKAAKSFKLVEKASGRVQKAKWTAMAERVCALTGAAKWPAELPPLGKYAGPLFCWRLAYQAAVIYETFKFEDGDWDNGRIRFEEKIGGKGANWALGLAVAVASEQMETGSGVIGGSGRHKFISILIAVFSLLFIFCLTVSLVVMAFTWKNNISGSKLLKMSMKKISGKGLTGKAKIQKNPSEEVGSSETTSIT